MSIQPANTLENSLQQAKNAFLSMATLTTEQTDAALEEFATII